MDFFMDGAGSVGLSRRPTREETVLSSAPLTRRTVRYNSVAEIETRIADFEACRIPKEEQGGR